ncbi:MAG: zinc ribbon domain-containing protein [Deltaproteobacteria bacterium]|nr:zinc ribbon domain-containing protein [Deltaproteobacteria bacterium]NIS76849.1 zinc ribbon domain-containing protein [Deltaproteobacteria bacterium]
MPTYSYTCNKCKNEFELVLSFREFEEGKLARCPACKSKDITQNLTLFYGKTSKKS